jgi:cytochrome P450
VPANDFSDLRDHQMGAGEFFADYIDWRAQHPSDDLMTDLLNREFEDDAGVTRRLTRDEVLVYVQLLANAGSDTTKRLIGWMGKVLADHPDQRAELVDDPSLIPNAIEELLRFEPPPYHVARYVNREAEFHGTTVPAGSALVCIIASANRDARRFPDGDAFDIHRRIDHVLTFGYGAHFCLGAALARLEGRIALEEVLRRIPTWDVDWDHARLWQTSDLRGWATLPVFI